MHAHSKHNETHSRYIIHIYIYAYGLACHRTSIRRHYTTRRLAVRMCRTAHTLRTRARARDRVVHIDPKRFPSTHASRDTRGASRLTGRVVRGDMGISALSVYTLLCVYTLLANYGQIEIEETREKNTTLTAHRLCARREIHYIILHTNCARDCGNMAGAHLRALLTGMRHKMCSHSSRPRLSQLGVCVCVCGKEAARPDIADIKWNIAKAPRSQSDLL